MRGAQRFARTSCPGCACMVALLMLATIARSCPDGVVPAGHQASQLKELRAPSVLTSKVALSPTVMRKVPSLLRLTKEP